MIGSMVIQILNIDVILQVSSLYFNVLQGLSTLRVPKVNIPLAHIGARLGFVLLRVGSVMFRVGSVMLCVGSVMLCVGSVMLRVGSVMLRVGSGMLCVGSAIPTCWYWRWKVFCWGIAQCEAPTRVVLNCNGIKI